MIASSYCCEYDDSSLILDFGNVPYDMPHYMMRAANACEIGLIDVWSLLDIGKRIVFRFGPCVDKKDELSQRCFTYDEAVEAIEKYPIVFWVPQQFSNPFAARVKYMTSVRSIAVDLDNKVDMFFWTKTREIFDEWGKGNSVSGIPCPKFFTATGNGLHAYWLLAKEQSTDKIRNVAKVLQRLIQLKLSTYYDKPVDKIHIVQALRVPDSSTKAGNKCRAFKIDNASEMPIIDLAKQCFSESEFDIMEKYLNDECTLDIFTNILESHAIKVGIEVKPIEISSIPVNQQEEVKVDSFDTKIKSEIEPLVEINTNFNPSSIMEFSSIIDNESSIRKKIFAKKCIYALKVQAPIKEGFRDNRLFGLSVALAKCGTKKEALVRIVNMANDNFCDIPLEPKEVGNCTIRPYKYIYMRDPTLRLQLGISNWPTFTKHESTMTRKDAAKIASTIKHKRTALKLREAYSAYGFNVDVTKLCEYADIVRQTYYNYKKSGVIREIMNWFINLSNYESIRDNQLIKQVMQMKQQLNIVTVESDTVEVDQFTLAIQSRTMADYDPVKSA